MDIFSIRPQKKGICLMDDGIEVKEVYPTRMGQIRGFLSAACGHILELDNLELGIDK